MQEHVQRVITDQMNQTIDCGPMDLKKLAEELALWSLRNNVNDDGSRLRERGIALAGAIMDWAVELYPNYADEITGDPAELTEK